LGRPHAVPGLSEQCPPAARPTLRPRARLLAGSVAFLPLCSFPQTDFHPARNGTVSWERKTQRSHGSSCPDCTACWGGITVTNLTGTFNVPFMLPRGLLLKTIYVGVKRSALGQAHHLLHPGEVPKKSQPCLAQTLFPVKPPPPAASLQPSSEQPAPVELIHPCAGRPPPPAAVSSSESPKLHSPGPWQLGQLEASVHADGVAQLLPQDALLAVVGELEEVETRRGGWEAPAWLFLADCEEAPQHAAQRVTGVLNRAEKRHPRAPSKQGASTQGRGANTEPICWERGEPALTAPSPTAATKRLLLQL